MLAATEDWRESVRFAVHVAGQTKFHRTQKLRTSVATGRIVGRLSRPLHPFQRIDWARSVPKFDLPLVPKWVLSNDNQRLANLPVAFKGLLASRHGSIRGRIILIRVPLVKRLLVIYSIWKGTMSKSSRHQLGSRTFVVKIEQRRSLGEDVRSLPILPPETCEGCGLCCEGIGSPVLIYASRPGLPEPHPFRPEKLPQVLIDEIEHHFGGLVRGQEPQDKCLWYDSDQRSCRHYEFRPQLCRDYELGGRACLQRRQEGVAKR
jgi:Fe-S-cluster containining protein